MKSTLISSSLFPFNAKIEKFPWNDGTRVTVKGFAGNFVAFVLAAIFRRAAASVPPASVFRFEVEPKNGKQFLDVTFDFKSANEAAAFVSGTSGFSATFPGFSGEPELVAGDRFDLSFRGTNSSPRLAAAFALFVESGMTIFRGHGSSDLFGVFTGDFEMQKSPDGPNPVPFVAGELERFGFTDVTASMFGSFAPRPFIDDFSFEGQQ